MRITKSKFTLCNIYFMLYAMHYSYSTRHPSIFICLGAGAMHQPGAEILVTVCRSAFLPPDIVHLHCTVILVYRAICISR